MFNKLRNKKGFTLMEMLIVVAIIAILVAIAIPTFNSSLKKAKQAADMANIRAKYAEATTALMIDETTFPNETTVKDALDLNYPDELTWGTTGIKYTDTDAAETVLLELEYPTYEVK